MKLLFVCTGNTCRSPMAEGLAKLYFSQEVEIASAGLHAFDGDEASPNAVTVIKEKGIDLSKHSAKRLTRDMMDSAELILTMTHSQERYMMSMYPEYKEIVFCLGSFCRSGKEVPDPFGGSIEMYRECAEELEQMIKALVLQLGNK